MDQIIAVHSLNVRTTVRNRWLSLLPSVVSGVTLLILGITNRWSSAGVPSNGINFGDLRVITTAAQCAAADPSWSIASTPCDPTMAMYNYPSFWAQSFARIGTTRSATASIASIFMLVFLIGLWLLTFSLIRHSRSAIRLITVLSIAAISPPVLLAAQRGNIDLVVFGFMSLGLGLYVFERRTSGAIALGIATGLKLFPIGSGLALLFDASKRFKVVLVFVVVSLVGISLSLGDLRLISEKTPQLDGASFGSALLPFLLESHTATGLSSTAFKIMGWFLFIAVFIGINFIWNVNQRCANLLNSLRGDLRSNRSSGVLFLGSTGTFLVAYLIGPSFDYRLIFLIPAIGALAAMASRVAFWLSLILLAQLLLSYSNYVGAAQYLSDIMLIVIAPLLGVVSFRLIRNPQE